MPITANRDDARRWLRVRGNGILTLDHLLNFLRTARSSEELRMWPMLVDAATTATDMTDQDVDRAAAIKPAPRHRV